MTALAIPRLLSWGLLRKLPALFLYPFRRAEEENSSADIVYQDRAELLVLAVAPDCRNQGAGQALISCLESYLHDQGKVSSYRVTTNAEDPVSNAFYKRVGFEPIGIRSHHALSLRHYRKRLPSRPSRSALWARAE